MFKAYQEPGWELLENNQEITIHIGQGSGSEVKIVCEAHIKADIARVPFIVKINFDDFFLDFENS